MRLQTRTHTHTHTAWEQRVTLFSKLPDQTQSLFALRRKRTNKKARPYLSSFQSLPPPPTLLLSTTTIAMVQDVNELAVNTIRALAGDMTRGANSGHPGR